MINEDVILACVVNIKELVSSLEKDIGRAKFESLYEVGLLQGQLIGLDKARNILLGKLEELDD